METKPANTTLFKPKSEKSNISSIAKNSNPKTQSDGDLLIVVFYGVSCLGKTTFSQTISEFCKTANTEFHSVSFDGPGGEVISRFKKDNPEITDGEEIFFRCWSEITALFHNRIFNLINSLKTGRHILFLDDGKIDPTVLAKLSSKSLKPNFRVKLAAIYPMHSMNFELNEANFVPFSPQLLFNLCHRSLNRKNHSTVNYDHVKTLQVILSFALLYKNINDISEAFKSEAKYSEMLEVQFHQEMEFKEPATKAQFEQFRTLCQEAILSINEPFESLKTADVTALDELGKFLMDEGRSGLLKEILSFGDKRCWVNKFRGLFWKMVGNNEVEKENCMALSN
jgi:hypothetical protein